LTVRGFPQTAGPLNRETQDHSALGRFPSRVLHHLPRNGRSVSDRLRPSLEFRCPSTASLVSPRSVSRAVHARLGAALRFSQPLSGFSFDQVPRPCFMPQPFLDYLPSERSPRRGRAPVPGPLVLPCSYPPCLETRRLPPYCSRFHRLPRLSAVAWIPRELWVPFSRGRNPASRSPWAADGGVAPSASFTCFEALIPL
jgi:hypothetical protein